MALSFAAQRQAIADAHALAKSLTKTSIRLKRQDSLQKLQAELNRFVAAEEQRAIQAIVLDLPAATTTPAAPASTSSENAADPKSDELLAKYMVSQALEDEFDYITWDRVNVDNYETFIWRALRFIDEDWFTPLRNVQYWAAGLFNHLISIADRWVVNSVVFGVAIVLSAINIIAEYRRNKHLAEQGKWDIWRDRTTKVKAELLARLRQKPSSAEAYALFISEHDAVLDSLAENHELAASIAALREKANPIRKFLTLAKPLQKNDDQELALRQAKDDIATSLKNNSALQTAYTEALAQLQRQQRFDQAAADLIALQDKVDALFGPDHYLVVPYSKKNEIRFRFLKKKPSMALALAPDEAKSKTKDNNYANELMHVAQKTPLTTFGEKLIAAEESFSGHIASTILTTLKFYAFPYWVTWFSLFFIFGGFIGAASPLLPFVLLFAIPAIPSGLYLIARTIRGINYLLGQKPTEAEKKHAKALEDIKNEELAVSKNIQRAMHYDQLVAEISERFKGDYLHAQRTKYRERVEDLVATNRAKLARIFGKDQAFQLLRPTKDDIKNDRRISEIDAWIEGLKGERTAGSLRERKTRAVMIGLYSGVVWGSIFAWVGTDVLSVLFKLSWASLAYGNIPIAAGLVTFIALYTAYQVVSNYTNAVHDWNKHAEKLNTLEKQLTAFPNIHLFAVEKGISHFEAMREFAKEVAYKEQLRYRMKKILQALQQKEIAKNISGGISEETLCLAKKVAIADFDGRYSYVLGIQVHSDRATRRGDDVPSAKATASSVISKVLWRMLAIIDGLGSGSLIVRMFLGMGGICLILFPSIPFNLILAGSIAGALALIIAAAKLYRYHMDAHQGRLTRFADEGMLRASQLEAKNSLLDAQLDYLNDQIARATQRLEVGLPEPALAPAPDLSSQLELESALTADASFAFTSFLLRAAKPAPKIPQMELEQPATQPGCCS